jgi:Protein of unknown function (DUF2778)
VWTYHQLNGHLNDLNGALVGIGYSGFGVGHNNPAMEAQAGIGPIPRGKYTISAPVDTVTHGPYVLRLNASLDDELFGRSGFLIHGDSVVHPGLASHGCIIMLHSVRQAVWDSGDHSLEVQL